jgi:hypothetical protein
MANKRISELVPITTSELDFADLLLISDISAHESKKLQLGDLSSFLLLDGRLTGSLLGTASYAMQALSASYAPFISASYAKTSSWALNISTASYAMAALSASYSLSSSYCITASYALTSSVELVYSSAFADFARTSSYLLFTPGAINGTASYALTASFFLGAPQVSASYANTSSWAWNAITASRAVSSLNSDTASYTLSSSYLNFNGIVNGTASYALVAGTTLNVTKDYGIFASYSQSVSSSQLDMVAVTPALGGQKTTTFEAYGTVVVPFTSSAGPTDGDITLVVVDRQYGYSQSLDASPVYALFGAGSNISGTLKYPFTLRGEAELYGLYEVYVTASGGVFIEGSREVRFKITSESDQIGVSTAEPLQFFTYPSNAILLYSSSLHPGVSYQGSSSQVTFSGSYDVTELLVPANTVNIMQYTWTLTGLQKLKIDDNSGITFFGGIPLSCISASAANCGLTELPNLISGSISYLNVPNNNIIANLSLPPSMSFLNVTNNFFISFPVALPAGMLAILADGIGITSIPFIVPNTLLTMSFAACPNLTSWLAPSFPTSLQRWNSSGSPFTNLPTVMPDNLKYMDVGSNVLPTTTVSNIASGLVANGLNNGYLSIRNNPGSGSAFGITANLATLVTRGWTIVS